MPAACRIPDGGWRDGAAEFRQFAVDPAVSPRGFALARRMARRATLWTVGARPGLRRLLVLYFFAASLRRQAMRVAVVTGKSSALRLRGMNRAAAANQARSAGPVTHPAHTPAQHRVLVPEHQQPAALTSVNPLISRGQVAGRWGA